MVTPVRQDDAQGIRATWDIWTDQRSVGWAECYQSPDCARCPQCPLRTVPGLNRIPGSGPAPTLAGIAMSGSVELRLAERGPVLSSRPEPSVAGAWLIPFCLCFPERTASPRYKLGMPPFELTIDLSDTKLSNYQGLHGVTVCNLRSCYPNANFSSQNKT